MGLGKILLSFFCLFLIFGFFFMRGAILELKEKTEDLKTAEEQIKATMKEWKDSFRKETAVPTQATPESSPVGNTTKPDPLTEEENFSCVLRTWDGKIGIFTPDGYLMRLLDVDIRTLPKSDLSALEAGIPVHSRAELLERIEDFGE